ncbi:MAG: chromosome segregation protein SMC [Thermoplasmata archaeon]|nr:chromosome segregation protein SMC [Thermoplasmata archaeon]
MYLKEIQMRNFKTFTKPISITFERGFTAVTGPNGSGKSNISDAVLFVLGPKSSRVIRAGKLTDLIFNGGKEGKPAKECECSLIFDNTDRTIPIDADEVKLTRVVKISPSDPSGYNSYFYVNDKKSTLTEFEELLANARISADSYNIVRQGDITSIVEKMTPVDIRRIIDGIAGITKFDEDIKKADEKRAYVEDNLSRISIILEEHRNQLGVLEKDRETAIKYMELRQRLEEAKASLAHKKRISIEGEIASIKNLIEAQNKEIENLKAEKEKLGEEIKGLGVKKEEIEKEIVARGGEEFKKLKTEIDGIRLNVAKARDRIAELKESTVTLKNEKNLVEKEIQKLEKSRTALQADAGRTAEELKKTAEEIKTLESRIKSVEETISKSDTEISGYQKELLKLSNTVDKKMEEYKNAEIELGKARNVIENLEIQITNAEEEIKTREFELRDAEFELKELGSNRKTSEKSIQELTAAFHKKRGEVAKLETEIEKVEDEIRELTRTYNTLKAQIEARMGAERGAGDAVNTILDARNRNLIKGIHGTVAQLARFEEKYSIALGVAAGPRMNAIVVDDDGVAAQCIEYLKQKKAGRAIFIPLNKILETRPRGKAVVVAKDKNCVGFAIDLLEFEEKYRPAFSYVFGDTLVMKDLDAARAVMGGVRLVTLAGELIEASGAMVGGSIQDREKFGAGALEELDRIGKVLGSKMEEERNLTEKLKAEREALRTLEDEIRERNSKEGTAQLAYETCLVRKKETEKKLNEARDTLARFNKELENARKEAGRWEEACEKIRKEIEKLKAEKEEINARIMELTPKALGEELKAARSQLQDSVRRKADLEGRLSSIETNIKLYTERLEEQRRKATGISDQIEKNGKEIEKLNGEVYEGEEKLKALLRVEETLNKELADLQQQRDEIFRQINEHTAERDKIDTRILSKNDIIIGQTTKLRSLEEALAEINIEIMGYKVKVPEKLPSNEELKRTIADCENAINLLGPVNMKAIEDYDALKKRIEELKTEFDRLEEEKHKLIDLVKEITEKKKTGFYKVYTAINENFKRIYAELSDGGEAELVLENPDNPFEGGLHIKAKPKNKKVIRLESLSGGEKSLTGLAFIFAIQQYDPSPFYFLDEVDMFLDAINAEIVAKVIKKNSAKAQFIMISLRKVTLQYADRLYGVTLEPNGTSKVVALELDQIKDMVEEKPKEESEGVV